MTKEPHRGGPGARSMSSHEKKKVKEKLLKTVQLHGKTGGGGVFHNFYTSVLESRDPLLNLASIVTEGGALAVTNKHVALGFCDRAS